MWVFFPSWGVVLRLHVRASHTINRDINTATSEMVDPIDEMVFHRVKASGKSEYRRGMPDKPRKCCGKNVMLTPRNITQNWVLVRVWFRLYPVNSGNQWVSPPMIAKTAPMDKT